MRQGLTFDDVLLVPKRSSVFSRKDIDTSSKLSRNISLNVPIVASNMDTVCESKMSIVMAQLGAILALRRPEMFGKIVYFAGIDNVRFRKLVVPGD